VAAGLPELGRESVVPPASFAIDLSVGTGTPNVFSGLMPNLAMPSTFFGFASFLRRASICSLVTLGRSSSE